MITLEQMKDYMEGAATLQEALNYTTVFTHVDDVTGENRHFCTGIMNIAPAITSIVPCNIPVDQAFAKWMVKNRGAEQHRLIELMSLPSKDIYNWKPLLVAELRARPPQHPTPEHLIIDGTHRYIVAAIRGLHHIPARIVPEVLWHQYLLEDGALARMSEQDVIEMPSGIGKHGMPTAEGLLAIAKALSLPRGR